MAEVDAGITLGSIDILAALVIFFSFFISVNAWLMIMLAVLMIIKCLWNYHKFPTPLNPVAALDVVTAFILVMLFFGVSFSLFSVVGFLQLVKGGFSFMLGIIPE